VAVDDLDVVGADEARQREDGGKFQRGTHG
jgi:hypothetical protein